MNDGAKIKILMLASNDILNDPRVQKEAAAAAREGFEVTVAGLVSGRIGPGEEMLDGYRIIRLDDRKPELTPPVIIETAPPRGWWQNSASPWLSQTVLGRGISRVRSTLDRIKITFAGGMPHISWLGDEYGDDEAFRESLMTVNLDDEADSYRFVRRVNRVFVAEGLRWRPQVCHCNDLDSLLAGVVLKRRLGTRIVFDAHELWTEMSQAKSKQWKDHFVRYEATLLPYADAVISVNDSIGE